MKKLSALFCALAVTFTAAAPNAAAKEEKRHYWDYNYWNFETEEWELSEEGQEIWEAALEARRENPGENKQYPEAHPYKCVERLTFKAKVKDKYLAGALAEVAGSGSTITGSISQFQFGPLQSTASWYLSLKGKGGTLVFSKGVPQDWAGFNYDTTGNILKVPVYSYIDKNGKGVFDEDYYETESDCSYYIYVSGKPKNGKVSELQIWQPLRGKYDEENRVYLLPPGGDTDVLDCYDIKYEYTGDPENFENGRNLYTLFGVSDDVDEYIAELEKKEEFKNKYTYDEGPANNHRKPLRYESWNGKMDGGASKWDFNLVFAGKADIFDFNAGMYQYLRGVGGNPTVSVIGIEPTRDGKPYDCPYPMVRVKGSKGEAWFDISEMAMKSDDGQVDTNPRAVWVKLYKLKDFKNFVKYEDLTAPDDEITMVLYFRDDELTELDRIVFDFGPMSVPGKETWTVDGDSFDFTGDIAALTKYNDEPDYFGLVLDMLGIEL